jgi:hypothetical protein
MWDFVRSSLRGAKTLVSWRRGNLNLLGDSENEIAALPSVARNDEN